MAELGRRVSLSPPAVAERVQRLEQRGRDHRLPRRDRPEARSAIRSPRSCAWPPPRQLHRIPEIARETPEVVECYRITGEDCFFLKLHLRSMDDLEDILDRFVLYGRTTTSIVHSAPVARRTLPLDE